VEGESALDVGRSVPLVGERVSDVGGKVTVEGERASDVGETVAVDGEGRGISGADVVTNDATSSCKEVPSSEEVVSCVITVAGVSAGVV
jgi:hypothetical protein